MNSCRLVVICSGVGVHEQSEESGQCLANVCEKQAIGPSGVRVGHSAAHLLLHFPSVLLCEQHLESIYIFIVQYEVHHCGRFHRQGQPRRFLVFGSPGTSFSLLFPTVDAIGRCDFDQRNLRIPRGNSRALGSGAQCHSPRLSLHCRRPPSKFGSFFWKRLQTILQA